jgi:outer membrane receptor protein involved in Fe transport
MSLSEIQRFPFRARGGALRGSSFLALVLALASSGALASASATIEGRVVDEQGKPLPGVTLTLRGSGPARTTASELDGSFRFEELDAPATYRLDYSLAGESAGSRLVVVAEDGPTTVDLVFRPGFLEEVTVTATREERSMRETPLTVGFVNREELAETRPTHPSQILSRVPGVWVSVTGGEGHMTSIRHPLTTSPVYLYLEDGVPTRSTGFFNHNALYEINVPAADRIEVTKGPGSALYGSDAIGGVVNVVTRSPFEGAGLDVSAEGGSYGWRRALASGSMVRGANGLRAEVNLSHTDGWRDATGYDRVTGSLRWDRVAGGGWSFKTLATFSDIDQETAGTSTLKEEDYLDNPTLNLTPISFRAVTAFRLSTEVRRDAGPSSWSFVPYFRYDSMDLLPNWSLTYDPTVYNTKNDSFGVLAKYRRDFSRVQLVGGVDLDFSPGSRLENQIRTTSETLPNGSRRFTDYEMGPVIYDYDVTFGAVSPYLQLLLSPTERLRVDAGLRLDHMSYDYDDLLETSETARHRRPEDATRTYDHLSPKLGATYELTDTLDVFASYRHAFRAPAEGQLFRQGSAANTIDLEPVKADNYEAGFRAQPLHSLALELSVYRLDKRDDILSYRDPIDGLTTSVNAGKTSHRGVEAGVRLTPWSWLTVAGAYSYARHRYEEWIVDPALGIDYSGNEQETAPRHLGNLLATATLRPDTTLSLELARVGSYWMDAGNVSKYDGHTLLHLRGEVLLGRGLTLFARLLNVADARYADSTSYTVQRGRELAPGLPRTLYAGLAFGWSR